MKTALSQQLSEKDEPIIIPTNYVLYQNYPNPFNPSTTIKYSIPKQGNVTLKVFDVLGSEVTTLVNKEQSQGNYEVEFDGSTVNKWNIFLSVKSNRFCSSEENAFTQVRNKIASG